MRTGAGDAHLQPAPVAVQDDGAAPNPGSARVLIVGLGNPVLGDDGVGWRVAEQIEQKLKKQVLPAEVTFLAVGGLRLMEHLIGWEAGILIDAITTGKHLPGHVTSFPLADLPAPFAGHMGSAHDASLPTALSVGEALGAPLPDRIWIVAVEAQVTLDFSEALSPPVAAAVEPAAREALRIARNLLAEEADR
jgi:hydrogenase maturation protease